MKKEIESSMMRTLIAGRRCWSTLLLAFLFATAGAGQSHRQLTDSLKEVVAEQRLRIHIADSIGSTREAIAARMHLATLVRSKEAFELMNDAAALAWSARLMEDEATVRTQLVRAYVNVGDHRRAYEQAMRLVMIGDERLSEQTERSGARTDSLLAEASAALDRSEHVSGSLIADAEERAARQHVIAQRWMVIASGVGVIALLVIGILLVRGSRRTHGIRMELAALRTEVEALRSVPRNRIREVNDRKPIDEGRPATTPPVAEEHVPGSTGPADDELRDILRTLMQMLRKKGPERLATLRDARSRGDHEKVVRVVHTLKPQLVAIDADALATLCADLTAPGASSRSNRWNADLDAFEKGLDELIAGSTD